MAVLNSQLTAHGYALRLDSKNSKPASALGKARRTQGEMRRESKIVHFRQLFRKALAGALCLGTVRNNRNGKVVRGRA